MRGRRLLFGLVLAASLATNLYLIHTRGVARASAVAAPEPARTSAPVHPRQPVASERPPANVPDDIAKLDRATLEERLRLAEAKLDAALPLNEKFDLATGGPENEPRVRTVIDRVFGVEGSAQGPYELECRGDLCRFASDRPAREWQEPLQLEMLGLARGMLFGDAVYFRVTDPATAAANQYVIDVATELSMSPALAACKRGQTATGTVVVTLRIVERHVEVTVGGALADAPVGTCIGNAAKQIVRATPLPDGVTSLPLNDLPVRVP